MQLTRDLFAIAKLLLINEPPQVLHPFRRYKLHAICNSNKKLVEVALLALNVQHKERFKTEFSIEVLECNYIIYLFSLL